MGRVKPLMIKKAASQLFEKSGEFSEDFEHNKRLLHGTIHYKSVRNKIAGGIVRLARQKRIKEQKETSEKSDGTQREQV